MWSLSIISSLSTSIFLTYVIPKILCEDNIESKCRYFKYVKFYNILLLSIIPFSGFILLIILGILILWYKYVRQ